MMQITAPTLGRLLGRDRTWAWRHIRRGDFGPDRLVRGARLVPLSAVESYAGMSFTADQIERAGGAVRLTETEDAPE